MAPQTLSTTRDAYEGIDARGGGNVNVNRFTLPKDPREILVAVILSLSILVNLWCGWIIRDVGTRKWLHDYDLNQFQMNQFAGVQKDVEVTKELVKNYGIGAQKCVK